MTIINLSLSYEKLLESIIWLKQNNIVYNFYNNMETEHISYNNTQRLVNWLRQATLNMCLMELHKFKKRKSFDFLLQLSIFHDIYDYEFIIEDKNDALRFKLMC